MAIHSSRRPQPAVQDERLIELQSSDTKNLKEESWNEFLELNKALTNSIEKIKKERK